MVIVQRNGERVSTEYQLLASKSQQFPGLENQIIVSLLALNPLTLRSYQIRASCFALNAPILGDSLYYSPVKVFFSFFLLFFFQMMKLK